MKRHLPRKSCLAIVLLFDLKKVINLLSPSSVVCKIGWSDLFCYASGLSRGQTQNKTARKIIK